LISGEFPTRAFHHALPPAEHCWSGLVALDVVEMSKYLERKGWSGRTRISGDK
jgi:hypothetical protein